MSKTFQFGKSTVVIHSPLAEMSSEDRSDWFRENKDTNPHLLNLRRVLFEEVESHVVVSSAKVV